jgi:hypothetical protein
VYEKAVLLAIALGFCLSQNANLVAQDNIVVVKAFLDGGQEEPNAVLTGAHGVATVTSNRTTRSLTYVIDVYDFPSRATAAHIHVGPPRAGAGPVIINFVVPANSISAFRLSGTATTADLVPRPAQGIQNIDDAFFAIAAGVTYANVHSELNGGGEIRGRLCPASAAANTFSGVSTCPQ